MITIQEFIKSAKNNNAVRENVPMGYGAGLPMLRISNDNLLVSFFYYRVVLHPDDKSLIMPPEYTVSFDYPSGKLVSFENLRTDTRFEKIRFGNSIGTFRHDAIKHLNNEGYKKQKEELYNTLNKLIASLGDEGDFTSEDEEALKENYSMMAEPSLYPFYKFLSPQFFNRYIQK